MTSDGSIRPGHRPTGGDVERLVKGRVDVTCDYAPATAK